MNEHEYNQYVKAVKNYAVARYTVLIAIILTLVNLVASFFNTYFLSSIYSSTLFFNFGIFLKQQALNTPHASFANGLLAICIVIGIIILSVFALFYFLSKKKAWAMTTITVLVAIDTALIPLTSFLSALIIPDLLFHGLALFVFIRGIKASKALNSDFDDGVMTTTAQITEIYQILNSSKTKNHHE